MSLRARLTLGTALLLAVAVAAGFLAAYFVVRNQLRGELDNALRQRASTIVALAGRAAPTRPARIPRDVTPPKLGGAGGYLQFVNANGKIVLAPGEHVLLPSDRARAVAAGRQRSSFSEATVAGTHVRIYTTHFRPNTALEVARPLTEVDHVLSRLQLLFSVISLVAVAGAAAVGLLLSRATLRPVRRLTDDAERIAATGDLRERTDQSRSDELGRLAVAFNTMLDALAASISAQRQLVADASHELRTPLAAARTNLEVVDLHPDMPAAQRHRILAEAIDELKEMTHLIEELVDLARGDAQILETHPTRLDLIVEEAVAAAARRSGRYFQTELEPTIVDGAPAALGRAISNLLDNAVKWSPIDSTIEVFVANGVVSVRDHGPGIAPEDLPHIFDRFYRAAAARTLPGSGLGLAIVRQIADAHGGSVTAETTSGGGSLFTLRIPAGDTANRPKRLGRETARFAGQSQPL
jgi:two-component system sensor histidine kinase MprB